MITALGMILMSIEFGLCVCVCVSVSVCVLVLR
jgi:hypothetical protein